MFTRILTASLFAFLAVSAASAQPLGTAFTYQGRLKNGGSTVAGLHDLRFRLYDSAMGNGQVGAIVCISNVNVTDGMFTLSLDFGVQFAGQQRFLEIDVRAGTGLGCANAAGFIMLAPRQPLAAAPNAIFASNADTLDGLDSTAFLQSMPVPLTLTGTSAAHIIRANNASTTDGAAAVFGSATANSGVTYGGRFESASLTGRGVFGEASSTGTGNTYGVYGLTRSSGGNGVVGQATAVSGVTSGLYGVSDSTSGRGVFGFVGASSGSTIGVSGLTASTIGRGVVGEASSTGTGNTYGVHGLTRSSGGNGVVGQATAGSGVTSGLYGVSDSTSGRGVFGFASAATGPTLGGSFESASSSGNAAGVFGSATAASGVTFGVWGQTSSTVGRGVYGKATAASGAAIGVYGRSDSSSDNAVGVFGTTTGGGGITFGGRFESTSPNGFGVFGWAKDVTSTGETFGVYGRSDSDAGRGVYGTVTDPNGDSYGVYGGNSSVYGYGVYSGGNFGASGTKNFRIDHPDDPEKKYLLHYCTESPEVINFYRGTVVLDGAGEAVVELPRYFAKINKTPSYMLTAVGAPMPMLHVARKISEAGLSVGAKAEPGEAAPICSFGIAGGAPGGEVSWRVEAVRNDRWVQRHGTPVEVAKQGREKGTYQHPEFYGQPAEKGMNYDAARTVSTARPALSDATRR